MPILEKDELGGVAPGEGDACAYYFWAITLFFFTLAFINFIVLMVMVAVLGIGPAGMDSMEFLPDHGSVKFLKDLIAPSITIGSGLISGYVGEDMNVVADNGDIVFQVLFSHMLVSGQCMAGHFHLRSFWLNLRVKHHMANESLFPPKKKKKRKVRYQVMGLN